MIESAIAFLSANWLFVGALLVILVGPQLVAKLKEIKLPSFKLLNKTTVKPNSDVISKDLEAIQWLANRAVDVSDQDLIMELENVNKKFYHIHIAMRKSATSTN